MDKHTINIILDIALIILILSSVYYFYTKDKTFELLTHDACRLCEKNTNASCIIGFVPPTQEVNKMNPEDYRINLTKTLP